MATNTPNYDINYDDERFTQVESEKSEALTDLEQTYGGMIGESDKFYQDQINASKDWADKQQQLQQEKTDFTIEQIEQQKDQAHKDYLKEQSGAYVDWQKQSNQYGANAERMASSGLTNTGFSESSQVSMYNTYQNRVATAREVYNQAVLNYDNSIKDARLQNNAVLAEIAYQALQQQLELSLQGFQYKNQLLLDQYDKKIQVENMYHQQWLDVLDQMNTENALAEQVRQFNEDLIFRADENQKDRDFQEGENLKDREHQSAENLKDREHQSAENALNRTHDEKILKLEQDFEEKMAEINQTYELALINARTEAEKKLIKEQYNYDIKKLAQELENDKALLAYENSLKIVDLGGDQDPEDLSEDTPGVMYYGNYGATVCTPYYAGRLNPDAEKYGTFQNGYQPKGISGHGKLKKSGDTVTVSTEIRFGSNKGQKQQLEQSVWRAEDGTLWYWEGRQNKYIQIKGDG